MIKIRVSHSIGERVRIFKYHKQYYKTQGMKQNTPYFSSLYHPFVAILMFSSGILCILAAIVLALLLINGYDDITTIPSLITIAIYAITYFSFRYLRVRIFEKQFPLLSIEFHHKMKDKRLWLLKDAIAFCSFRMARRIERQHTELYGKYESLEESHEDGIRHLQASYKIADRKIHKAEMADDNIFKFINDSASIPEVVESANRESKFYKYKTNFKYPSKPIRHYPLRIRETWKESEGTRVFSYSNEFITHSNYYTPSFVEAFPFPTICTYQFFEYQESELPLPILHLSFEGGTQYSQIAHMQSSGMSSTYYSKALSAITEILPNCAFYFYPFSNEELGNDIKFSLTHSSLNVLDRIEDINNVTYPSNTNTIFILENNDQKNIDAIIEQIKDIFIPNSTVVILKSTLSDTFIEKEIIPFENTIKCINKGFEKYPIKRGVHYLSLYPYYPKSTHIMGYSNQNVYRLKDRGDVIFSIDLNKALKSIFDGSWFGCYLFCVPPSGGGYEMRYHKLIVEFVKNTKINVLSMPSNFSYIRTSRPKHLGGDGACEIAFKEHTFTGKSVIIFDDVITSGSTIQHYKRIIEEQGGTVLGAISIGETMYSRGYTAFQDIFYKTNSMESTLSKLRNT